MQRELHVRAHLSVLERWRHGVEIVALVVAAVWGFYVFIYQENLKPRAEPVDVTWKLNLTHDRLTGDKELVRGSFTMNNVGQKVAWSGELIVNVYGRHYIEQSRRRLTSPWIGVDTVNNTLVDDGRHLLYSYRNLWEPAGGTKYHYVGVGENDTFVFAFATKNGAYDEASVDVLYCETDREDLASHNLRQIRRPDGSYWVDTDHTFRLRDMSCVARQDAGVYPL